MSYYILQDGFEVLMDNGFLSVLVFMLVFGIVYGVLQSIGLFASGKKNGSDEAKTKYKNSVKSLRKIHALIAMVLAMLSILPHYYSRYGQYDIIPVLTELLPKISIGILLIISSLILLGLFGIKVQAGSKNPIMMFIFLAIVGIVIYMVGDATYWWDLPYWLDYDLLSGIIAVLVFVGIVKFVIGSDDKDNDERNYADYIKEGKLSKIPMSYWMKNMFGHEAEKKKIKKGNVI